MKNIGLLGAFGFSTAVMLLWHGVANAEPEVWEAVYNEGEISVKTAVKQGSNIKSIKAETVLPASLDSVMAVLADPDACDLWIHGCLRAEILDSTGFSQRNTYQVNDFPWPTQDRDLVLEVTIEQDIAANQVLYTLTNRPDYYKKTDNVRIASFEGRYLLTVLDQQHTRIEWTQHADPGGNVPAWLVNSMIVDVPVKTLEGLTRLVQQEPYASAVATRDASGYMTGWEPLQITSR